MRRFLAFAIGIVIVAALTMWVRGDGHWDIQNQASHRPGIIILGDSLSAGLGLAEGEVWHHFLPSLLQIPPEGVFNAAVNGATLEDGVHLLPNVLARPEGTLLVLLGGNDQLRQRAAEAAMADLARIVDAGVQAGKLVIVCDFSPAPGLQRDWARGFRDVAREHGAALVTGVADGLYTTDRRYLQQDRVHLTPEGQRHLAARVARGIARAWGLDAAEVNRRIEEAGLES